MDKNDKAPEALLHRKGQPTIVNPEFTKHCNLMTILQGMLESHDWMYSQSDDNRIHQRGLKSEQELKAFADNLGRDGLRLKKAYVDTLFSPAKGFAYYYPEDFKTEGEDDTHS